MKCKIIAGTIFLILAGNSYAVDGIIKFTGRIDKAACVVNNNLAVEVELGTFSAAQFTQVGKPSPEIPVVLPLTNCPITQVEGEPVPHFRVWLQAESVDADHPDLIKVGNGFSDPEVATGVGIQIKDAATKAIMPLNSLPEITYDIKAAVMNINLVANYVSTVEPGEIHEGSADANVDVTLDYR